MPARGAVLPSTIGIGRTVIAGALLASLQMTVW